MTTYLRDGERYRVAVVGLGKLGLPMAAHLSAAGHIVTGYDNNPRLIEAIRAGECPIVEPDLDDLLAAHPITVGHLAELAPVHTDAAFVIVPTPSDNDGRFSTARARDACDQLARGIAQRPITHRPYLIVVCSTVMPGACETDLIPAIETHAGPEGDRWHLVYSPEFIALGSVLADMATPDMVLLGGRSHTARDLTEKILSPGWVDPRTNRGEDRHGLKPPPKVHHLALLDAEVAKLAVNTYVTMKISWANQLGAICERAGVDGLQVARAVGDDTRVGGKYLRPAAAYGGPCFPRDTEAFEAWAADQDYDAPLAMATKAVNDHQARRVADAALRGGKGVQIAVLGAAYKPGTPVTERSFGLDLARELVARHAEVTLSDPLAADPMLDGVKWEPLADHAVRGSDVAVIATGHPEYADLVYPGDVIDCWGIVPEHHAGGQLHRVGVGR